MEQARTRAAELRQAAQANAARQVEQTAWSKIDQNNREQLLNYVSRFSTGIHAQEARARVGELDREAAENLLAQRRKEQKDAEQARISADEHAVVKVLREFEAAYNRMDLATLQQLWAGVPVNDYRRQFRDAKSLKFQLQLIGKPVVSDNSATATCSRTLTYQARSGDPGTHAERVKVTLTRESTGWQIRSMVAN
jgi:hypothetical protein